MSAEQRYSVFWADPDKGFQGVLANLSRSQLPFAFADATRWAYGLDAAEQVTHYGYRKAVDHTLAELEQGGTGVHGRITIAYAADDYNEFMFTGE